MNLGSVTIRLFTN